MKMFCNDMVGDGFRTIWLIEHDIGSSFFVYNLKMVDSVRDATHGIVATVKSIGATKVQVEFGYPPDKGQVVTLILIG